MLKTHTTVQEVLKGSYNKHTGFNVLYGKQVDATWDKFSIHKEIKINDDINKEIDRLLNLGYTYIKVYYIPTSVKMYYNTYVFAR